MVAGLIADDGAGGITYAQPLVDGVFLGRRKRFFADVRLQDGREVVAHCANTGAMTGVSTPGAPCRVMHVAGPGRRLDWSLEQISAGGAWTMIHTARPNRVVEAALRAGRIDELREFSEVARERPLGDGHRVDLVASRPVAGQPRPDDTAYIEVKNVTWVEGGVARFPDAVSVRATAHVEALTRVVADGARAVVLLHVARGDACVVEPASEVDPAFAAALGRAIHAGVAVRAFDVAVDVDGVRLRHALPVRAGSGGGG